jgi:triphosphatase
VFSKLLRSEQTEAIKRDLKWLAGKLAPVRDLDVFLSKVKRLAGAAPAIDGLADLTRELEYRRALAAEAARAAVASSRYRLLIFNALEWIEDGTWLRRSSRHGNQLVKPFAVDLFVRRTKKTKRRAKKLRKFNVRERHKLRIAIKKLRYTIYFFESLFKESEYAKALSRYKDRLGKLQDSLGALNDIAVHHKLLTKLRTDRDEAKPRLMAFAAGAVVGTEYREVAALLQISGKAASKLRRAEDFWI